MDCTYATNRYKLLLLSICGFNSARNTYSAAYVFLAREDTEHYVWALQQFAKHFDHNPQFIVTDRELALMNAIKSVYPGTKNLLCMWHINRHIQSFFNSNNKDEWSQFFNDWNSTICSESNDVYMGNIEKLLSWKTKEAFVQVVEYIEKEWLRFDEMIVRFKTNVDVNFNTFTTSIVESNHNALKLDEKMYRKDFIGSIARIDGLIKKQLKEFSRTNMRNIIGQLVTVIDDKFFDQVRGKISHYALSKAKEIYERAKNSEDVGPCINCEAKNMGLPCIHLMTNLLDNSMELSILQFDQQWRLQVPKVEEEGRNEDVPRLSANNPIEEMVALYDISSPAEKEEWTKQPLQQFLKETRSSLPP
ncbi:hypothetical protein RCL1_006318 [Eukaryota sp. TZLM3-RCL]